MRSLGTADGDWKTVYDFHSTPFLSGATAAAHGALLVGVWLWWRRSLQRTVYVVGHAADNRKWKPLGAKRVVVLPDSAFSRPGEKHEQAFGNAVSLDPYQILVELSPNFGSDQLVHRYL